MPLNDPPYGLPSTACPISTPLGFTCILCGGWVAWGAPHACLQPAHYGQPYGQPIVGFAAMGVVAPTREEYDALRAELAGALAAVQALRAECARLTRESERLAAEQASLRGLVAGLIDRIARIVADALGRRDRVDAR